MKGKYRGILVLSILILIVLVILLRNSLISQPRVENDTPDIYIIKGQDSEISTRDNDEIEDKEPIQPENRDNKDSKIQDQQIVNKQDNLNDNQEASSLINKGDKEQDYSEEQNVPDEEKDNDIIIDTSPENPVQDEDKDENEDSPDSNPDPDPDPNPDPDESYSKIQLEQENIDDSYGPIVSGK